MAVTQSLLTNGADGTNSTSYTTASITPTANSLVLIAVATTKDSAPDPTITGNGMTWVKVNSQVYNDLNESNTVWLYRALDPSPSTGTVSIDFGASTQFNCQWIISEFGDVDSSGTNGSGAIAQSASDVDNGDPESLTVSLSAFTNSENATFGLFTGTDLTPKTINAGTGFTKIAQQDIGNTSLMTEWRDDADTSVDASWSGGYPSAAGIAVEIKKEPINVTVTPTVVTSTFSAQSPSVSGGASITTTAVSSTFTVNTPTVTTQTVDWTYESRPAESVWTIESQ